MNIKNNYVYGGLSANKERIAITKCLNCPCEDDTHQYGNGDNKYCPTCKKQCVEDNSCYECGEVLDSSLDYDLHWREYHG